MSKTVLGVYNSKDALVKAIEEFQNEGYSLSNFSVLANLEKVPSSIENKTGAASVEPGVEVTNSNEDLQGILKSLFLPFEMNNDSHHQITTYYDKLVAEGINEADARKYEDDIRSGMIILLADNGPGTGSSSPQKTEAKPMNGEGVNGDITEGSMVNRPGTGEVQDAGNSSEGSIPELHEDPLDPPQLGTGAGQVRNGEAAINETRERFVDPKYS